MQSFDAVVVGGGLAGKACALALVQQGMQVLLCGSHPAAPAPAQGWSQRVYAFNAASRRLLTQLQAWPQIPSQRIEPVARMRIAADGAALQFSAWAQGVEALAWIAESDAVERALDLALQFARGLQQTPERVEQAQRSAGRWQLQLGAGQVLESALLVGADGRHSRVREWAGIGMHSKPYGQSGVVANFSCSGAHGGSAFQSFTANGVLALLPLPAWNGADQVSLVWSAPEALAAELVAAGPERLAERLQQQLPALGAEQLGCLQPAGEVGSWPLLLARADSLVGDGLALIGDAAHVLHPLAGHGLNLGLQDVQALAAVLATRSADPAADPRLLRRYARARAEQVRALELATDGLHRLYDPALSWLGPLRGLGLALTDHLPPLKRRLAGYASGLGVLA